jgi:hypothetical protein
MVVPCAIALAAGMDHSRVWRESGWLLRGGAAVVVCLALVVAVGTWPTSAWKDYADNSSLGLPGTGLMRIDPKLAATLRGVAKQLRAHCDTFYGVPNLNSFYVFSGLPPVTGMVANGGPAGLTAAQQQQVVVALQRKLRARERVCILRQFVLPVAPAQPQLRHLLKTFSTVVARIGPYTISRHRVTPAPARRHSGVAGAGTGRRATA